MTDVLHRALDSTGDEIKVSVSRETAEWLARIVDARSRGSRPARRVLLGGVSSQLLKHSRVPVIVVPRE